MSRLPMKGEAATLPPPSLELQLAELRREAKMRQGVYPHWIANGKMSADKANYHTNALDGAIATLQRLVDAKTRGEPGRVELVTALREAAAFLPTDQPPAVALHSRIIEMLDKVPT